MSETVFNVVMIFLFILIGGVFAAAEMALVSLRDSQVKQLARRGKRGRLIAQLTGDPNRFLSAVQIGVTLAGFLSAAFGGTTIAKALAPVLEGLLPISRALADTIAVISVTAVISYVSIVLGELTAKRLALQRAEAFALTLAPVVELIAKLARPAIWLLDVSTNLVVRVLGAILRLAETRSPPRRSAPWCGDRARSAPRNARLSTMCSTPVRGGCGR